MTPRSGRPSELTNDACTVCASDKSRSVASTSTSVSLPCEPPLWPLWWHEMKTSWPFARRPRSGSQGALRLPRGYSNICTLAP